MRFLLYNIRYATGGRPGRGPFGFFRRTGDHLDEIIRFIKEIKPDISGLIEVDAGSYRTRRRNQAQVIANALGHSHTYRSKYSSKSVARFIPVMRKQGNAFIVSDPKIEPRFHYFRKGVKRLLIELEMQDLVVYLVHLALGGRTRHQQLHDLYTRVKGSAKPCMVAGDFNTLWGEHEIQMFMAATGLASADAGNRPSFPSWAPRRHLDFILHSPEIVIDACELPHITLSDHLPIVCDFHIRRRP